MALNPRDVERGPVSEEGTLALIPQFTERDSRIDPWSWLSHKLALSQGGLAASALAPDWVGHHKRRLTAYRVYAAYLANMSRIYLPTSMPSAGAMLDLGTYREYGDAITIRDMAASSVLGEDPEVVAVGSEARPERPPEPAQDASDDERSDHARRVKEYDEAIVEYEAAVELQEWFDAWADHVRFPQLAIDHEHDTQGMGDGVFVIGYDAETGFVEWEVIDPGWYFPVESTRKRGFFTRVHLAWEEQDEDDDTGTRWVVRTTYEIRDLPDGGTRNYPWREGDASTKACFMTAMKWKIQDLGDRKYDDFNVAKGVPLSDVQGPIVDRDLGFDFMPVIHATNGITKQLFGESILGRVAQILDDLGANDTDAAIAADLNAAPPLVVKGRRGSVGALDNYGPRQVIYSEAGAELMDTSEALTALGVREDRLLARLSVTTRMPASVLGRKTANPDRIAGDDNGSGIQTLMSYAPFKAMIREMRLVLAEKYALAFTFTQRIAMLGVGEAEPGKRLKPGLTGRVEIRFGSYMPTDLAAVIEMVVEMVKAHVISRSTGLAWLRDAGVPVDDDLRAELERVQHEDFEGAKAIADATSDESAAGKYLGIEVEEVEPVAAPGAPTVPPEPGPPVPTA